jgi:hypothetical protein
MGKENHTDKRLHKAQWISNPLCKRLYTLKEAAQYMGRSEYSMRALMWSQDIPVVKGENARKVYFDIADLDNYINQNKSVYT